MWVCSVTYFIKKVFRRRRVTGEDMKTSENTLMKILNNKKFLIFLMIFELRNFEEMSFYIPPRCISCNFKVVWKFFEKWYEDKQKFLWKLRHRAFKRTNSHVHTTARKKVLGIFRKKRARVYPLELNPDSAK